MHTHSVPGKIELAQRNTKAQVSRSQPEGGTVQFAYRGAVELCCYDSCLPLHLVLMLSDKKHSLIKYKATINQNSTRKLLELTKHFQLSTRTQN